jgi:hypothetical protein
MTIGGWGLVSVAAYLLSTLGDDERLLPGEEAAGGALGCRLRGTCWGGDGLAGGGGGTGEGAGGGWFVFDLAMLSLRSWREERRVQHTSAVRAGDRPFW